MTKIVKNKALFIYLFAVLIIAFFTYFQNYSKPAAVFWDENYHIASASKYLEGVMYMEPHPPLGKLFIALGEYILHPNDTLNVHYFTQTDYIKKFPAGYSFEGMRLFPTLFGAFASVLFFLILYRISRRQQLSFLFTSLYLFANAFILQSRSAMLESTQTFFIFLSIYYFLVLFDRESKSWKEYFILGIFMGLAITVKINGLIVTLLYPFLYFYRCNKSLGIFHHLKYFIGYGLSVLLGILIIWVSVFYIHFNLGTTLGAKSYKASSQYKEILKDHTESNPTNFPIMMKDSIAYMVDYTKHVPKYNPCKKGENGSLATTWPFGNKSINYRWSKKDGKTSYLYLQINPIIWFSIFLSIVLASALMISKMMFGLHAKDTRLFYLISLFTFMYFSYMVVMFNAGRVMYLYHYFVPLFFGAFVLFLLYNYIFKEELENNNKLLQFATYIFIAEVIYVFWYFSVFTYYTPITTPEFIDREWFEFWKLKPIL